MGLRTLVGVLLCLLTLLGASVRGFELAERELSIADIPKCGLGCFILTVPTSGCSFEDLECQCQNEELAHSLSACMLANCTMADSLDTARVQAALCNLSNESRTHEVRLYTIIVFSIAVVFVALRVLGKALAKRLSADDYILVLAMFLTAVPCGCIMAITFKGFGNHLWDLQHGQLKDCLKFFYISWSTYVLVLGLIKISLIMFYLQIFASRTFRITAFVVLGYIIISTLVIFLTTIFACLPVQTFWNRDTHGKCLDINALAYANSGNAIAHDIILLILPLMSIRKLNMARYRKVAVGLMFSIGTFGCIATIIRLHSLLSFRISIDPTWDYVPVTIWTELELGCGFVCVSLPAVRILLTMILPKKALSFFASITSRSSRGQHTPTPIHHAERHRGERKGLSWLHIPTVKSDSSEGGSGQRSFGSSLGSRLFTQSRRDGSIRLSSFTDQDRNQARTPQPSPLTSHHLDTNAHEPADHDWLEVPRSNFRVACTSCGSEGDITALPRLGCLPDGSFSREDFRRKMRLGDV